MPLSSLIFHALPLRSEQLGDLGPVNGDPALVFSLDKVEKRAVFFVVPPLRALEQERGEFAGPGVGGLLIQRIKNKVIPQKECIQ